MISSSTKTLLYRIFAFFVVMLVGALLFLVTEGRHRNDRMSASQRENTFQRRFNISNKDYELLLEGIRNDTMFAKEERLSWSYGNSLYFVIVLITTIGYGHLTPVTWQGQLFCIFFSLVGIPITAMLLKSVGEYITHGLTAIITYFERRVLKREAENLERKCFICCAILMIMTLLGGAVVTSASDDWSLMEGVYFTFVTLTTIGFGDYVVNDGVYIDPSATKTIVTQFNLLFLILGLSVVSSLLCSISKLMESGGLGCCKCGSRGEIDLSDQNADADVTVE